MDLRTLSATALETFIECPSRYHATHILRAADEENEAAAIGKAVHGALEIYVRACYVEKVETPSIQYLSFCYRQAYAETFGSLDVGSEAFLDGAAMLKVWFGRTNFEDCEVLLLETKENFPVPIPGRDPVPFNYVFDRLDQLDETTFRVVDYKTIRATLTHEQLRRKLQARAYGLAAQIRHKNATRVYVEFDLLRHERIGVAYTRDENADTWRLIKGSAKDIWTMTEPPERLNANCRYCVRAASCATLQSNVAAGGTWGKSLEELVDLRFLLESQQKGVDQLLKEIDTTLLHHMQTTEQLEIPGEHYVAEASVRWQRTITDQQAIAEILGPVLAAQYGSFRLGDLDRIMKEEPLTPEQRRAIQQLITRTGGEPKIKTRRK